MPHEDARTDIILRIRGYDPATVRSQAAAGHKHWQRILAKAKLYMDTITLLRDAQAMLINFNHTNESADLEALIARLELKIQFLEKYQRGAD